MLLGLFLHGAVSFMELQVPWATRDRSTHVVADAFISFVHTFRMPVFFLLAGFFSRLLYEKLGPAGFARHRVKRILVPFVVTLVPLMPSLYLLWRWGNSRMGPRTLPNLGMELPSLEPDRLPVSPGHLWFLYYLMMIVALMMIVVPLARRLPLDGSRRRVDAVLRILVRSRLVLFVMALPTALTLIPMVTPTADTPVDFIPQLRILAYYAVFSGFGWLLHRQADLVVEIGRKLWVPVVVALAVLAPLGILGDRLIRGGAPWSLGERVAALYLGALFSWSLVLLFIGAFVRWGDQPRAWVAYLSDASYWCYLVHLPIVVALQILVAELPWPGALKYGMVMTVTIAACLGSYQALVRYTFIGRTLNGPREKAAPAPVTP